MIGIGTIQWARTTHHGVVAALRSDAGVDDALAVKLVKGGETVAGHCESMVLVMLDVDDDHDEIAFYSKAIDMDEALAETRECVEAALAVVLSLVAFVTVNLANRKAFIEARWERGPTFNRIVVVNHGPSLARSVDVRLLDSKGQQASQRLDSHVLPIPELNAGQDFHLPFMTRMAEDLAAAELSWKDGRLKDQTSRVWLSRREII